VELDICHSCLKETLGPWLRLSPAVWAESKVSASEGFMAGVERLPVQERDGLEPDEK
jgi:hypothetical protein